MSRKMTKRLVAMVSSIAVMTLAVGVPVAVGAANNDYISGTDSTKSDFATDSLNTTTIKKVLQIEDTSAIPQVNFTYTTTAGAAVAATYDNNSDIVTMEVLAGVDPDKITYKEVPYAATTSGGNTTYAFNQNGSLKSLTATTGTGSSAVVVSYASQAKEYGDTAGGTPDDNVIINDNVDDNCYYAIKEIQMDFSNCKFQQPGIYRYIITEDDTTVRGVTCDQTTTRTLDVYVEDDGTGTNADNKLTVTGYVMYNGTVTTGPQADSSKTVPTASDATALEDGLINSDGNFGTGYGTANGYEPTGATKSEGFKNEYSTVDIKVAKTVTGNQGSKNKYFKFTLTFDATDVADTDVYYISQINGDNSYDAAPTDVTGSRYTAANMTSEVSSNVQVGGNTMDYTVKAESAQGANDAVVVQALTGAQLKNGYSFYLQDGQYITITGIKQNQKYTLTEYQEDYEPSVAFTALRTGNADNSDDAATPAELALTKGGSATASMTAGYTDNKLTNDTTVTFTNDKSGTIPTGVIVSVAAPVGVGALVLAGLYVVNRKKKDIGE